MRSLVLVALLSSLLCSLLSSLPSPASAQYVPAGRPARVRFVGSHPAITFHVPTGSTGGAAWSRFGVMSWSSRTFSPVCHAPCERWMPEDTYRFALSLDGGGEIMAPGALRLVDGATIYGHYVDNSTTRTIGAVVTALSALGCAALAITGTLALGLGDSRYGYDWDEAAPHFLGAGAAFVAMWVGLGMMWAFDHTEIRVLAPGESL